MISIRASEDRGKADFGWLKSRHSFSFGNYFDPAHMGFGPLRVINEDRVVPGAGFDTHGHRDMEIISYVLEGALEHKDSTGTGSVIRAGDIQRMSAGTGILHSEYNHSDKDPVHFLQIWIMPDRNGVEPGYEQKKLDMEAAHNGLALVAGPEAGESVVKIHQDARMYVSRLDAGSALEFELKPGRGVWVQVARGDLSINGRVLIEGDGAAIRDEQKLLIEAGSEAEIMLFDLPLP